MSLILKNNSWSDFTNTLSDTVPLFGERFLHSENEVISDFSIGLDCIWLESMRYGHTAYQHAGIPHLDHLCHGQFEETSGFSEYSC
ncbi:hypothetical protein CEXT_622551 [Caerostris extrusa]|uniref:Uncharacterized protein n=1 Tax=Caerostris extrusa TaxID=172846 RepID=A0AAV4RFH0_CAEEX|nr:hypothetical protein CEXT_622551 [Caerostris extrusa]